MTIAAARAGTSTNRHSTGNRADSSLVSATVDAMNGICTCCLWLVMFAVPFMMAGVRETGTGVFVACSLLMGITWAVQQFLRPQTGSPFSYVAIVGFAAVGLVSLQLIPLPKSLAHQLSPFSATFLSAWNANHEMLTRDGYWTRISLTPALTRSGLVLLIAYTVFFLTLHQRLRKFSDIDSLLRLVAIATVAMAAIGVGQLFFGNGDFLWMFHHPFRDTSDAAKGTFTNQNHFAHFLALGIGPLIWWWKKTGTVAGATIQGRVRNNGFGVARNTESYQQAIGGAFAIVVFAGVLSFSRGGIAAIVIAAAISMAALGRQAPQILRLTVPATVFMTIGVFLFGTELLEAKLDAVFRANSLEDLSSGRFLLWSALLSAVPSFWPAGAGVGSHAEVYPTWMEQDIGKRLSHAESGYMQILIETGLPGLLLIFISIAFCIYWFVSSWNRSAGDDRMRLLILSAGLVASVLHSIADFAWYIPACTIYALILAACLCRTHQLCLDAAEIQGDTTATPKWPICWAMIVIVLILPVGKVSASVALKDAQSEGVWMAYREQSVAAGQRQTYESLDALDERLDAMVSHLEECIRIDPTDFRAMTDLSAMYLRRFERNQQTTNNPMSIREIRSTVASTDFESPRDVLSWLKRAFGENFLDLYRSHAMARRAVQGQPLRGQNYLVLAQVGFLTGLLSDGESELVEQAVRLRPFKAPILYFAGLTELEKGDIASACRQWKKAFHLSAAIKPLIVRSLASQVSPQEITEHIQPRAEGLWVMFREYRVNGRTDEQRWTANRYADEFESFEENGKAVNRQFWLNSHDIFMSVEMQEKAVYCLHEAVQELPSDYQLRKKYGLALLTIREEPAAIRELEWCRLRNPDDREITEALATIDVASLPKESS